MHGGDGLWGTVFASLFRTVLSSGAQFYLYDCVRWFSCDHDQHVFGHMNSALI